MLKINPNQSIPQYFQAHEIPLTNSDHKLKQLPPSSLTKVLGNMSIEEFFKNEDHKSLNHYKAEVVYDNVVKDIGERYRNLGLDQSGVAKDVVTMLIDLGLNEVALHFIADVSDKARTRNPLILQAVDRLIANGEMESAISLLALHDPLTMFSIGEYPKGDLFGANALYESKIEMPKTIAGQLALRLGNVIDRHYGGNTLEQLSTDSMLEYIKACYCLIRTYDESASYGSVFSMEMIVESDDFLKAVELLKDAATKNTNPETTQSWKVALESLDSIIQKYGQGTKSSGKKLPKAGLKGLDVTVDKGLGNPR